MAVRYSGNVTIRLTYHDPKVGDRWANGYYICALSWPGGRKSVTVGAPAYLSQAVDSAGAYDDTASAAISFADYEGPEGDFYPAWGDGGPAISRKKR